MALDSYTSTAPGDRDIDDRRGVALPDESTTELATALQERVEQLQMEWAQSSGDRKSIREIVEYASGDQLSTAPRMPNETDEHWSQKPRTAPNFLGTALDKLATIYNNSPVRTVTRASQWRRVLWGGLDATLSQQDRAIMLTGTVACVLLPEFDGELQPRDAAANPTSLRPLYFTPDRWVAIADPTEPTRPAAVAIHWRTVRGENKSEHEIHYYWDGSTFAILRDWQVQWAQPHGFGVCPVAMLRNTLERGLYGRAVGGRDLIENARAITGYIREVVHTARLQRGQPYSKGPLENPVLGPDSLVIVDEGGDFAFANNGADLPGMLDTLERLLAAFAISIGLPRGALQLTGTLDLAADHTELARYRQRRAPVAQQWEREIHRVASAQWAYYQDADRWDTSELHTAYVEDPPPMSVAERLQLAEFGLVNGLRDEYATARSLWPHLSEAEIKAMVDAGLEAQKRRAAQQAAIAGHARDVDGGMPTPDNGTEEESTPVDTVEMDDGAETLNETEPNAPAVGEDVQQLALNGAQVQALQGVVQAVADGTLARGAAEILLRNAFPSFPDAEIRTMVGIADSQPQQVNNDQSSGPVTPEPGTSGAE